MDKKYFIIYFIEKYGFHKTETNIGFQLFYMDIFVFFQWNKKCFDSKEGILELKTWSLLLCHIITNTLQILNAKDVLQSLFLSWKNVFENLSWKGDPDQNYMYLRIKILQKYCSLFCVIDMQYIGSVTKQNHFTA